MDLFVMLNILNDYATRFFILKQSFYQSPNKGQIFNEKLHDSFEIVIESNKEIIKTSEEEDEEHEISPSWAASA